MAREKPSHTAEGVAAWRAAANREKDEQVRNPDYLALKFLGTKFYLISQFPPLVKLALRQFQKIMPGGYFFITARTKHIDATLQQCFAEGIEQLVILGAGYDSRPYRFADQLKDIRVFEVDMAATQARKRERVDRFLGSPPPWVTFVPMDFNIERLEARLPESGYDTPRKSFFIWEGVCMFISAEAVDQTLSFVANHSAPGSSIVFDYIYSSAVDGNCDYYGARNVARYVAKRGEPYVFGIEEGTVGQFLAERGFDLVSDFGPEQMESTYLIRSDDMPHGRMYGHTSIAHARVRSAG